MRRLAAVLPAAALAGVLLAVPAAAQQQGQTQQPPAQPQVQQPQVQQPGTQNQAPVEQTFGDWAQRCTPNPPRGASQPQGGETEACFIMQQYLDPGSQQPILKVTIGLFDPNRRPGAVLAMPLGVPLARGVQVAVDGKAVASVPFQFCRRDGCQAFMPLTDEVINAFKAGKQAVASLQSGQGETLDLPFSLSGFTAGYGSIK